MNIIGLTGPSGAGKSTVSAALASLGWPVIDADLVYHDLLRSSIPLNRALFNHFPTAFDATGQLQRKKLGALVFSDKAKLALLNDITHGFVRQTVSDNFAALEKAGQAFCVYDVPLLFESGAHLLCKKTVAVLSAPDLRIKRIMERDTITEDYARKRIENQKDNAFFREHCDYILENNGSPQQLRAQVAKLKQTLEAHYGYHSR